MNQNFFKIYNFPLNTKEETTYYFNEKIKKIIDIANDIAEKNNDDKFVSFNRDKRNCIHEMMKQFIFNLLVALRNDNCFCRYSRSYENFCKEKYYYKIIIKMNGNEKPKSVKKHCQIFIKIADYLHQSGIINHNFGSKENLLQSEMKFSDYGQELFREFINITLENTELERDVLILYKYTSKEKEIVQYKKSNFTIGLENFVKKLNSFYSQNVINCKVEQVIINNNNIEKINKWHSDSRIIINKLNKHGNEDTYDIEFEIKDKFVHRSFNYNSWSSCGRFFSLFTELPKEFRRNLFLNDENHRLVSLDYKGFNPRLCYHLINNKCKYDPYITEGFDDKHRDVYKLIFNMAMNTKSFKGAVKAFAKECESSYSSAIKNFLIDIDGQDLEETIIKILRSIENQHTKIKEFFYSGKANYLMNIESKIAEKIMKDMVIKRNRFVISIHDGFLFSEYDLKTMCMLMKYCYLDILKNILVKNKTVPYSKPLSKNIIPIFE